MLEPLLWDIGFFQNQIVMHGISTRPTTVPFQSIYDAQILVYAKPTLNAKDGEFSPYEQRDVWHLIPTLHEAGSSPESQAQAGDKCTNPCTNLCLHLEDFKNWILEGNLVMQSLRAEATRPVWYMWDPKKSRIWPKSPNPQRRFNCNFWSPPDSDFLSIFTYGLLRTRST